MTTKESLSNEMCLFCASDYHLEMILLPYIKEKIENSKFIIFSQNDLRTTIKKLLDRINIDTKSKEKIKKLNWKETKLQQIKNIVEKNNSFSSKHINYSFIINGNFSYITEIHDFLKMNISQNINIINCFHVDDENINVSELSKNYKCILNTTKINKNHST